MSISRPKLAVSDAKPVVAGRSRFTEKRQGPLFDMHYELELGVVFSGAMRRFSGDVTADLTPGQAWLCGMWEPHGFEILEVPCEILVAVIWPPVLASQHFPQAAGLSLLAPFTLPPERRPGTAPDLRNEILSLGWRIAETASGTGAARAVRLQLQVFDLIARLWETQAVGEGTAGAARPELFHQISPALDRALASRGVVGNDEAARLCHMSIRQFARVFHELMGITFVRFALCHRLRGAAEDLVVTQEPVKTVAAEWGFVDASHLHRLFLKHYGCSPAVYRARRRSQEPG